MDSGDDVAVVESHVADQVAFIANLRKCLEASDEDSATNCALPATASAAAAPVAATAEAAAEGQPGDPQENDDAAASAAQEASRQRVHVRPAVPATCASPKYKIVSGQFPLLLST
jgi:hypothetical protein